MATIDELMAGKAPGSVKVFRPDYDDPNNYFMPYYKRHSLWYGPRNDDPCWNEDYIYKDWQLWTPPKKKVKMWLWAYQSNFNDRFMNSCNFYTEEQAERGWIKIPGTEIEVDET